MESSMNLRSSKPSAAVAGLGSLQSFLDDQEIEEIWINEPGRVFVARRGRSELTTLILTTDAVADLVERMLRSSGRRIDLSTPFVDANCRSQIALDSLWREVHEASRQTGVLPVRRIPQSLGLRPI
jgi:Flp pilus assembly CpaF family ATPase